MNSREIDASRASAAENTRESGFSTIEASAVKRIVRESWESHIKERGTSLDILNEHAEFMENEFADLDYQTLCMQNIAARAKHMSKGELSEYTKALEALAVGYKARFGPEFATLLVAGITLVARDVEGAKRHLDYFLSHLSESESRYERRIAKEMRLVERLDLRLRSRNSGILRFLRKRELNALGRKITAGHGRIAMLGKRKSSFAKMSEETRMRADAHRFRKR